MVFTSLLLSVLNLYVVNEEEHRESAMYCDSRPFDGWLFMFLHVTETSTNFQIPLMKKKLQWSVVTVSCVSLQISTFDSLGAVGLLL